MSKWRRTILMAAALGLACRLPGLWHNSFHADEALFASWARHIAVWRDPLLLLQPVDKPPLAIYLQALFYPLFGPVAWAARFPALIASILTIPMIAVLTRRLYGHRGTALLVAFLYALSPYAIRFSGTAFLDAPLSGWLLAATIAHSRRLPLPRARSAAWAGFLFGLALATKYQAVLLFPLLLGISSLHGWQRRHWLSWLWGFLPVAGLMLLWDVGRTGRFSLWSTQLQNFGGLRLIWSWELGTRALAWLDMGRWIWGSGWFLVIFFLGALWLSRRPHPGKGRDQLLLLYLIGYALLHWLVAIPVWDRYLLPILPLLVILAARIVLVAGRQVHVIFARILQPRAPRLLQLAPLLLAGLFILAQLPATGRAVYGNYPVGGQPDADSGAADVAAYLIDAPYGTVLYDHWWSWQWRYHLFDRRVFVSWVPHAQALADDLAVFGDQDASRFLVLPDSALARPFLRAAPDYQLTAVFQSGNMILYEVRPTTQR